MQTQSFSQHCSVTHLTRRHEGPGVKPVSHANPSSGGLVYHHFLLGHCMSLPLLPEFQVLQAGATEAISIFGGGEPLVDQKWGDSRLLVETHEVQAWTEFF